MVSRPRIGLLGGSFDPPHVGHLALARAARDAYHLNEVRLLPTGQSWQKAGRQTDAVHRLAMTRLLVGALPASERLQVDDREVRRSGPTYTLDTLTELRAEFGPSPALLWILGSDQFRNLHTWRNWAQLLDFAHLAVTQRERVTLTDLPAPIEALLAQRGAAALPDTPAGAIVLFSLPPVPVSATALRTRIGRGEPADGLSAPAVLDYIDQHRLYRQP